jgi:hypothetical protein
LYRYGLGESTCRFCHTSIVPSGARNEGWPTCPNQVCEEMKALGCKGEDANSKKKVLWQLAREKAIKHNDYVKGISVGKCGTTPADRKLGRHQFSDASCKTTLGGGLHKLNLVDPTHSLKAPPGFNP